MKEKLYSPSASVTEISFALTAKSNGMHFKVSGYLMIISSKSFSIFFEPTKVFKMVNSTFKLSTFLNYISNSISLNTGATFGWFI